VSGGRQIRMLDASDDALTEGFHAFEPDRGQRWTDGDAKLPDGLFQDADGHMQLVLSVCGVLQYPLFG